MFASHPKIIVHYNILHTYIYITECKYSLKNKSKTIKKKKSLVLIINIWIQIIVLIVYAAVGSRLTLVPRRKLHVVACLKS